MTLLPLLKSIIAKELNLAADLIDVTPATNKKFGHYQCNSAMKLAKAHNTQPRIFAEALREKLLPMPMFSHIEVAGPGFINLSLSASYIAEQVNKQMHDPMHGWQPTTSKRVVIDFSSPNIAKEMHVGHLRSTIIGDCIARVLEFAGHKVLRLNHVGDWGTQFGMLITYLQQKRDITKISALSLGDLVHDYKAAKLEFDNNPEFKKNSQLAVVALQQGDKQSIEIWQTICAISRQAFEEIYAILDIKLLERGESFYNPHLAKVLEDFANQKLLTTSEGASCVYLDGFTNREGQALPLIIQKSDGAYNYATTDLAALKHRVQAEHANWIIYVTDAGQGQHFSMVFAAARLAHYYDPQKVRIDHVPFGLVLRADGKKFQTRAGDTERLIDLIQSAIDRAHVVLADREADINSASVLGINAIKYADLSNHRTSDYSFNLDRMLQFEGNTAAFLMYAYVRIQSIKRKTAADISQLLESNKIYLQTEEEIELGLHLLQFPDLIQNFEAELLPHRITDYLYHLAEKFHVFFHNCRVEGVPEQASRILLCEAVAQMLRTGFSLLGLKPLEKM